MYSGDSVIEIEIEIRIDYGINIQIEIQIQYMSQNSSESSIQKTQNIWAKDGIKAHFGSSKSFVWKHG